MHTDFLLDTFSKNRNNEAIIWKEKSFDYHQTITKKDKMRGKGRKSPNISTEKSPSLQVFTRVLR